jgi:hypothetical protein
VRSIPDVLCATAPPRFIDTRSCDFRRGVAPPDASVPDLAAFVRSVPGRSDSKLAPNVSARCFPRAVLLLFAFSALRRSYGLARPCIIATRPARRHCRGLCPPHGPIMRPALAAGFAATADVTQVRRQT